MPRRNFYYIMSERNQRHDRTGEDVAFKTETGKSGRIVLEIGCGPVPAPVKSEWPSEQFDLYLAGDRLIDAVSLLAPGNLEKLKERDRRAEKIHLVALDAKQLPLADNSVDEIIARNVFTIATGQMEEILREINRILKIGGKLIIAEIYTPNWLPRNFVSSVKQFAGLDLVGKNEVEIAYKAGGTSDPIKLEFKKP